ncbi:sensor histidine kinase [uncultured Chloroflexus sp.]|uniref:sensor histidine kinase n=1 Tax=uncultured Chloroflexus sp. TaxID=214040 RepID=UPI002621EFBE|nr:sensor histidine kinase [uncultured Chloroflexus sp.]
MAGEEVQQQITAAIQTYREEIDRTRREINEVESLLRQGMTEVDKLSLRETSIANRVRDLDVNLERYEKTDIKTFYTSLIEVQMRLQTMRAQVDQLQTRRETLRNRQSLLSEFVELLEQAAAQLERSAKVADLPFDPQTMIANIIQSQESERLRISLQMHDGPAQSMSNLVLRAEICQRLLDRDLDQARAELVALKNAVNNTLQETRKFIFDLRPMTLDDLGLIPTLRRYVTQVSEKHKIDVSLMVQNLDQRLPSHYEVTIFRFIQEAINNVVRHSGATQARVMLDNSDNTLQILIEDNGSGFAVQEAIASAGTRKNMGLANMRQQIEVLLQGEFGIESSIGRGTRVAATIPLP